MLLCNAVMTTLNFRSYTMSNKTKYYRYQLLYNDFPEGQQSEVELDTMDPHEVIEYVWDLINDDVLTIRKFKVSKNGKMKI